MGEIFSKKKNILGVVIAIILLYFALKDINFSKVFIMIRGANPIYFIIAIFSFYLAFLIRVFRTKFFLELQGYRARLMDVTFVNTLTAFFNRLTPSKFGEVYRILSYKRFNASKSGMLPMIYVSKVLDLIALLLFTILFSFFVNFDSSLVSNLVFFFAVLIISLLIVLIVFLKNEESLRFLFRLPLLNRFEERVGEIFTRIKRGLKSYSLRGISLGSLSALLFWGFRAFSFYCLILAFDKGVSIWFGTFLFTISILLGLFPLSPGGIGLKNLFLINAFSFQVSRNLAASITLSYQIFINYITYFIFTFLVVGVDKILRSFR